MAFWDRTQVRLEAVRKAWPGGKGKRGFNAHQQSCVALYPQELLSGSMECACCGAAIVKVGGKSGGYYGCLGAKKGACDNKLIVRRTVAEKVILGAVRDKLATPEDIYYVFKRVEQKVREMGSEVPATIRQKEAELQSEERRMANFVEFIAEGRGSKALAGALALSSLEDRILGGLPRPCTPRNDDRHAARRIGTHGPLLEPEGWRGGEALPARTAREHGRGPQRQDPTGDARDHVPQISHNKIDGLSSSPSGKSCAGCCWCFRPSGDMSQDARILQGAFTTASRLT